MAHNFRVTGDYYVSKKGNDANDGLTPDTAKLTVQAGLNLIAANSKTLVIGSGVYRENINKLIYNPTTIIGDGKVILESVSGYDDITFGGAVGISTINIYNIEFRNIRYLYFNAYDNNSKIIYAYNYNCIFKGVYVTSLYSSAVTAYGNFNTPTYFFNKCVFINSTVGLPRYGASFCTSFESCILINTNATGSYRVDYGYSNRPNWGVGVFKNSYLDYNSTIELLSQVYSTEAGWTGVDGQLSVNSVFPYNFVNNNIQGKIKFSWNGAVSTNTRNNLITLAQAQVDYPTYFVNSISANPLFNDAQTLNFTLQSSSPHIRAASDYVSNIGGTEYAVYKSATSTEFTSGATISGLTLRGNNSYTITSSPTPGTIETAPIFLQWPATKPLTKLEWVGSLEFNKSITAGTQGNTNVPDWDTYTTGAGANPDRLTVKMRFSTQQTQPTTSAQWDNGGYWTAGNYELFEINAKPKVDSNGRGNGNPNYIESSGLGDIVPTWIQLSIQLIDTYNP